MRNSFRVHPSRRIHLVSYYARVRSSVRQWLLGRSLYDLPFCKLRLPDFVGAPRQLHQVPLGPSLIISVHPQSWRPLPTRLPSSLLVHRGQRASQWRLLRLCSQLIPIVLDSPAASTPPGQTHNFHNPQTLTPSFLTTVVAGMVLSTLIVTVRIFTKICIVKKRHWEDCSILLSWILVVGFGGVGLAVTPYGGRHM
jgi:hypothetical protein